MRRTSMDSQPCTWPQKMATSRWLGEVVLVFIHFAQIVEELLAAGAKLDPLVFDSYLLPLHMAINKVQTHCILVLMRVTHTCIIAHGPLCLQHCKNRSKLARVTIVQNWPRWCLVRHGHLHSISLLNVFYHHFTTRINMVNNPSGWEINNVYYHFAPNHTGNNVCHFTQNHTAIAKLLIEKGAKLDEKSYVSTTVEMMMLIHI